MKDTQPARVCFGAFELDLKSGELRSNGNRTVLAEQPLQILRMLVERQGEMVGREEIRQKLWPNDTIVEFDHSINAAIKNLRRALNDSADEPQYIETLVRRGYRLMVPVEWMKQLPVVSGQLSEAAMAAVAPGPVEAAVLTGRVVSHYRLLDIIGGGGMGVVYRAEDLKLGRRVALKFLPEDLGDDPKARERFEREARAVSALNHPNICYIHEFDEYEGQPFIVMELLQGQTLREHLAAGRFLLNDPQALETAIQIAAGLEAAHEKGIIHRDIKPANIFITEKNVAKILDFGVAKLVSVTEKDVTVPHVTPGAERADTSDVILSEERSDESKDPYHEADAGDIEVPRLAGQPQARSLGMTLENATAPVTTLTRTGLTLGTAGYMSPEQVRGEPLDARTDIFSFGLVLYEMATGQRAFSGETEAILHDAILNNPPIPVRELNSKLPAKLVATIDKALEKDRERRYQSASEMRADFEKLKQGWQFNIPAPPGPRHWKWIAVVALFLAVALGGGLYWRSRNTIKLTDQDTIVLADFTNSTSDPVFDTALKPALEVAFGQTPFFNPLSGEKVSQTLRQMNKPPNERLTPAVAQEVCRRSNSAAYVAGSISDVGNQYRVELNAIDCKTGGTLAMAAMKADEQIQIVNMLGEVVYSLRQKLSEPPASLQRYNKPLAEATTASLEALQAFAAGDAVEGKPESVLHYQRAAQLDPEFALAYNSLGIMYYNLRQSDLSRQNYSKAYRLREHRLSRRDTFFIEMHYYLAVTGEYEKVISTAEQAARDFPRWAPAGNQLGNALNSLGEYEKASQILQESHRLLPYAMAQYSNLAESYIALERLEDASLTLDEAKARNVDSWALHANRYRLAFLQNNWQTMDEQVRWARGSPQAADLILREQSETEAYYGRLREADELSKQSVDAAAEAGAPERGADAKAFQALRLAKIGATTEARAMAQETISMNPSPLARQTAALAFAKAGDTARALQLAEHLNQDFPVSTLLQACDLPAIRAEVYLQQGKPDLAIRELERAIPYDLRLAHQFGMETALLRGEAYLKAGQPQQAAEQFRKVLDHPGIVVNSINGPLAHLQLARAQAMMGDKDAARKSYQEFLTLWKNADPDIPIYKQAKAEYAKLGMQ